MAKVWKDYPNTSTPITAAALNDLERRIDSAVDRSRQASEAVATGIAEIRRETTSKLDLSRIRYGSVTHTVRRQSHLSIDVHISPPLPSTNYTVILTLSGSGAYSPELATVANLTGGNTTTKIGIRYRNNANADQPLTCNYLIIMN